MAPAYKLKYFNAMGLAEPIRLLFAAAKVEYEDIRVEKEDWPNVKPSLTWGQMPVLEVDGVELSQSTAIARFVARKHGLAGETEMEAAKCDEYVDVVGDLRTELLKYFHEKDESKKPSILAQLETETFPKYLQKFTAILEKQGNGHLVGKKLTYADIGVAYLASNWCKRAFPNILEKYPVIQKFTEGIMAQPGIKEWIQKRPQTEF